MKTQLDHLENTHLVLEAVVQRTSDLRMKQWRPLEATRRQTAPRAAVGAGEGLPGEEGVEEVAGTAPNVPACVVRVRSPWD